MIELSPSLLAANFYNLKEDIEKLNEMNVKYLHLDVMDGNFVPNISYGPDIIKQIRPHTQMIFDTHLMIENPEKYIDVFADAGCDIITIHPESTKHVHRVIQQIKSHGLKAGIVLNPHTHESVLEYIINDIDLVLVMSVNPGFGGQSFIDSSLEKIKNIRKMIDEKNPNIILEIDGGVKTQNVKEVLNAGVNLVVSGSGVFNNDGIEKNVLDFEEIFKQYRK
ncbi:MAG: ribulose-phosphate 3-epimerase [Tissierellia bacterium]|nr:ribulose-phosphate 3-epimerase [Tissierellia bacterium]